MRWEVGGKFTMEGTRTYLWLIHADVWQKPTHYCKAIIFRLKTFLNWRGPVWVMVMFPLSMLGNVPNVSWYSGSEAGAQVLGFDAHWTIHFVFLRCLPLEPRSHTFSPSSSVSSGSWDLVADGGSRGPQEQSWVDKALHHLLMCPLVWHYVSWATCVLPLEFCLCIEILPHVSLLLLSWLILPYTGAHIWHSNPKTKWTCTLLLSKKMKIKILYLYVVNCRGTVT